MGDLPTGDENLITHAKFAEYAARMAEHAATWAADALVMPDWIEKPMSRGALNRFTARMTDWLDAINGR